MLIKEKVLSVLRKGIYSDLIKYRTREELEMDIRTSLDSVKIVYDAEDIRNLSKTVLTEGECVIRGLNIRNVKGLRLVNYNNAIKEELKQTDLSRVSECYKKRMLDVLSNRIYNNYERKELSIKIEGNKNINEILKFKIEELTKDKRNIVKFVKNTLRFENNNKEEVFFTVFTKREAI